MSITVRKGSRLYGLEQRNALELYLLAFAITTGLATFLRPARDGLPGWIQLIWAGVLIGGGLVSLLGMLWHDSVTGILINRAGLIVTGTGAIAYSIPIWFVSGLYATVVTLGFGVAAYARAGQITQQLRR